MTLTKKKMVREIGRRTRLTNREVQEVVEALVDVWTEALVDGEKIEIQNFLILEVKHIHRRNALDQESSNSPIQRPPLIKRVVIRTSKSLRAKI